MERVRTLAVALVALAVAATAAIGEVPAGLRWPARVTLVVVLPVLAGAIATLLLPRSAKRLGSSARVRGTARFHTVVAAVLVLDLAAIGAGYLLGWTTFTFGEQALEARKLLVLPLALPFTIAAATLGSEWALHARLWEVAARGSSPGAATALAVAVGTALAAPAIVPGFDVGDGGFVASALLVAATREWIALALFRAGGLLVAGAYRGVLVAIEAFGLADWQSFHFPLANYVSSTPAFDLLRVAGPLAAAAVVAFAVRRRPPAAA
jgi:hypothetical protein